MIEAVLRLDPSDRYRVELPTQSYRLCADMGWSDQLSALQSARWVTAVVGADRRCWIDQFEDRLSDPEVAASAARVEVVEDAAMPNGSARVTANGRTEEVLVAAGAPERPLERGDILDKLERAAGAERAAAVVASLADTAAPAQRLIEALTR